MTNEEQIMEIKRKEDEACLQRLQNLVQEKIVPIDPALVIGKLGTIDKAITWYIEKLENENQLLKSKSNLD